MRLLVRLYGMGMVFLLSAMIFLQMMSFNIRRDELVNCISTAMSSTQIVIQEQIEDDLYGTNTKRKSIDSNEEYLEEFATNFYKLVTTDSNFEIKVYGIDYTKGFLDVEVVSSFPMIGGNTKTITSRKTSIVDILM